ncbi:MAG: YHS domain-containing protein [Candidatus Binatia bacterium]
MSQKSSAICRFMFCGLIVVAAAAMAGPPATQEVERSKVCMLQDEVEPKAGTPYEYEGKTYYLCCPMCANAFKKEPEKFSKAHDPVSGQVVDKATAPVLGYKEQAYFFASDESRATFAKDPERYVRPASGEESKNP